MAIGVRALAAGCGAGLAVAAGASGATAWPLTDMVWSGLLGLVAGGLGASAGPGIWLVVGAALAPFGWGDGPATAAASLVLGAGLVATVRPRLEACASATAAAALPVALLRLAWPDRTGITAAVAAVVLIVLAVAGLRSLAPRERRLALVGLGGVVAVTTGVAIASALSVAAERTRIVDVADLLDSAMAATRAGDTEVASSLLVQVSAELDEVEARLDRPWSAAGRGIPIVSPQLAAIDALVSSAGEVATAGAEAANAVDPDRLRPTDGRVDLAVVASLEESLAVVHRSLLRAQARSSAVRSPWLLPRIDRALDDLVTETVDAGRDAARALDALAVIPQLFGADGERRWLVIMVTPSASRGSGGFPGNYGILRADDGRLELERLGRINDIAFPAYERALPVFGPQEYLARYRSVFGLDRYYQNSTASPHFPSVAESMVGRYTALTGVDVDGALQIDPYVLAALLDMVGPVDVPGWPAPISSANAASVLLFDQYAAFDAVTVDRAAFLEQVARAAFDRTMSGGLPAPAEVVDRLSPLVADRRIQLWSSKGVEQSWFRRIGAVGELADLRHDALDVVTNEAASTKLDWFMRRTIDYRVERGGIDRAEVVITLTNSVPLGVQPSYGTGGPPNGELPAGINRSLLSVFTPLELVSATLNGAPADLFPVTRERGRNVVELFVTIPPQTTAEVRIRLRGTLPPGPYELDLDHQPVVTPDHVRVTVDGEVLFDGPQTTDLVLRRR